LSDCTSFVLHTFMSFVFFFTAPPTPDIYTLSLHDALPISRCSGATCTPPCSRSPRSAILLDSPSTRDGRSRKSSRDCRLARFARDRKSTRLNSSHLGISYAVFCLKKKKKINKYNIVRSATD